MAGKCQNFASYSEPVPPSRKFDMFVNSETGRLYKFKEDKWDALWKGAKFPAAN